MNLERDKIRIPLWLLLAIVIVLMIIVCGGWYYLIDASKTKWITLVGGIITGLLVYLATFLTLLRPLQELDRFRRMGIKGLLDNRHDKIYYRQLLLRSKIRVDVMGASCSRFVRDFLDLESDDKVLIDLLNKYPHLKVRLLVPDDEHMSDDTRNGTKTTLEQVSAVRKRFGDRVELRRFNDEPRHSFVLADNDLVAGPVFDYSKSRHAPAIHVETDTLFAQKYLAYFDKLWEGAIVGS